MITFKNQDVTKIIMLVLQQLTFVDTPQASTTHHEKNSINAKSTATWNYLQNSIDPDLSLAIDLFKLF